MLKTMKYILNVALFWEMSCVFSSYFMSYEQILYNPYI